MSKIMDFMRICLQKKEIPISWGISNIITLKDQISFDVVGSKYQGKILIEENSTIISVQMKGVTKTFESSKDMFVWIDGSIE